MALAPGYMVLVVTLLLAVVLALVLGVARLRRSAAASWSAVLLSWFAAAIALSAGGAFASGGPPLPVLIAVVFPIALGAVVVTRVPSVRAVALAIPQPWLVSLHLVRLIGLLFLWLWVQGVLPGSFALPAGLGDVTTAIAAPFVAWQVARRKPRAESWLWAWNVFGILDFVVAVTCGALSANGPQRLFFSGPAANALGALPLSLVPTFGVPLIALTHLVSILQLRGATDSPPKVMCAAPRGTPAESPR